MMKPIFKKRSRNYYPAKIPVGSYLNNDDGFTMDRFLVVNKGNNVFVDPQVNMKELFCIFTTLYTSLYGPICYEKQSLYMIQNDKKGCQIKTSSFLGSILVLSL